MTRPEILPLQIQRLKGSPAWKWLPHYFGWYVKLLIEMADSSRTGYLPNDPVRLCSLANSWEDDASRPRNWLDIQAKFLCAWDSLLAAKFHTTDDRLWIYHPVLHNSLWKKSCPTESVVCKNTQGERGFNVCITPTSEVQDRFEKAYSAYPRHLKPRDAEKAFYQASQRLAKLRKISLAEAADFIVSRCEKFALSDAGQRGKFTPYMGTWLRADSFLESDSDWKREKRSDDRSEKNQQVLRETFERMGYGDHRRDAEAVVKP